ncbi:unnamed protein product [Brassicogethes aeneus]|uniref:MAGE domain-containing protein n=1 Tax=Brassicogethes aeneus TaxID=1431903 RepID=A0A9P0FN20_BRAAE|nr:unnamed protein product [Brassicogethes aeneus]
MSRKGGFSKSQTLPTNNKSKGQSGGGRSLTQPTIVDAFGEGSAASLEEQVDDVVRFFVLKGGEQIVKRSEVHKHVLPKAGRYYERVMERAVIVLRKVYGFNLILIDATANTPKSYILSNALSYKDDETLSDDEVPEDANKILLMLILTHIFMSNCSVNEGSVFGFLKKLNIDVNVRHPVFGIAKEYITNTLTKLKYLNIEADPATKQIYYHWGVRSEKEISKHDILKFVCKIYKDRVPENWDNQIQQAREQCLDNVKIHENGENICPPMETE